MDNNTIPVSEIMRKCGVRRDVVLKWIQKGYLTGEKYSDARNGRIYVSLDSFTKFLNSDNYPGKPEDICSSIPLTRTPMIEECYPVNFLIYLSKKDVNTKDDLAEFDIWSIDIKAFRELITKLNDREQRIIELRFHFGMTLDEVASALGNITRERVRQIQAKAGCKLKKWIATGKCNIRSQEEYLYLKEKYDNLLAEHTELKKRFEEIRPPIKLDEMILAKNIHYDEVSIFELNLTIRATNGLLRSRIKTIGDILRYDQEEKDWTAIRNLGVKTLSEIATKVFAKCGYKLRVSNTLHQTEYIGFHESPNYLVIDPNKMFANDPRKKDSNYIKNIDERIIQVG